jgi:hypothetical protein
MQIKRKLSISPLQNICENTDTLKYTKRPWLWWMLNTSCNSTHQDKKEKGIERTTKSPASWIHFISCATSDIITVQDIEFKTGMRTLTTLMHGPTSHIAPHYTLPKQRCWDVVDPHLCCITAWERGWNAVRIQLCNPHVIFHCPTAERNAYVTASEHRIYASHMSYRSFRLLPTLHK